MNILNTEPEGYSRKAYEVLDTIGHVIEEKCDRERLGKIWQRVGV